MTYSKLVLEPGLQVTGHRVNDFGGVGWGRVTGQCDRPGIWPGFVVFARASLLHLGREYATLESIGFCVLFRLTMSMNNSTFKSKIAEELSRFEYLIGPFETEITKIFFASLDNSSNLNFCSLHEPGNWQRHIRSHCLVERAEIQIWTVVQASKENFSYSCIISGIPEISLVPVESHTRIEQGCMETG